MTVVPQRRSKPWGVKRRLKTRFWVVMSNWLKISSKNATFFFEYNARAIAYIFKGKLYAALFAASIYHSLPLSATQSNSLTSYNRLVSIWEEGYIALKVTAMNNTII